MPHGSNRSRSPEIDRFGVYLRYGVALPENGELKFNPYRAEDGRFDFAPGHGTLPPRTHSVGPAAMTGRVQREMAAAGASYNGPTRNPSSRQGGASARSRYPSSLSAKYESGGPGDPGAISSVPGDPEGRSYGKYQFASKSRMIHVFIRRPEASRWAGDFRGLNPVTSQFDRKWKQVAARDPVGFGAAQENFIGRTNYDPVIRDVLRSTGLNLDGASESRAPSSLFSCNPAWEGEGCSQGSSPRGGWTTKTFRSTLSASVGRGDL